MTNGRAWPSLYTTPIQPICSNHTDEMSVEIADRGHFPADLG